MVNSVTLDNRENGENGESGERYDDQEEANAHIAKYVNDQLERIRSHDSVDVFTYEDEFEAQLDGQ